MIKYYVLMIFSLVYQTDKSILKISRQDLDCREVFPDLLWRSVLKFLNIKCHIGSQKVLKCFKPMKCQKNAKACCKRMLKINPCVNAI